MVSCEPLLRAAGVPPAVLSLVKATVDTCVVCRSWQRPGPRAVTSSSMPVRFNETVQVDILFVFNKMALHIIDVCTRFSQALILPSRSAEEILHCLQTGWFQLFGPPQTLISDQEGGLTGPESAAWLEQRNVVLKVRAKNQHADMVERHHEILRRQIHLINTNAEQEGLRASLSAVLSEAVFAKNVLFNTGGASPYEAVFGRIPPLVNVTRPDLATEVDDRDADRLRQ